MRAETRAKLAALGNELSPSMIQGSSSLIGALAAPRDLSVEIIRDSFYGADERNRLDIFRQGQPNGAPVLVFVHGGGFVMGDKSSAGSPFYENVGQWAAQQGFIGVTMTYRLAPQHKWPSGAQDVAHAVTWLRANIAAHGGDPSSIFLMGQSAGATHVAAYVAHERFHHNGVGIAGAVMISGVYDATTQPANPFGTAYYGDASITLAEARHTAGLLATPVPLLFTVSELDSQDFQDQAVQLVGEWNTAKRQFAPMEYLLGHNHLSPAHAVGSIEDDLGPRVAKFVATHSGK
ncbi:MAG: alpha/beta hydrolase [Steroidobacteraceae bacterium]